MNILLLGNASSIHIVRWANALSERGNNVTVATCKNDYPQDRSCYGNKVEIFALKYPTPFGYYLNAGQLKRFAAKKQFDVINVHYASGYGTLGRWAKLKNALLNIWGSDVYDFPYQNKFSMRTVRKNLLYFKALASTSKVMAKQAKKLIPEYTKEIYITPFGVDTERFKPIDGIKEDDKIIFGTVKTLSPKYGIADTIKAFIKLVCRLKNENRVDIAEKLSYEIYGRGELRDELQKLIDENEMTEKIKLCGYVNNSELPAIYNRFTVFNSNSILDSESFGVVAVEAMACGVPVQVSDADGFTEVVEDGVTGLIAPKGDIDAIAENMYRLITDEQMRTHMGISAVERVKRLYDWEKNVDTMEDIYRGLR